jgi:hypothetical protein
MGFVVRYGSQLLRSFGLGALLLLGLAPLGLAQKLPQATRVWSVGPLTKGEQVMGVVFGAGGATLTGTRVDSQTGSTFQATRSVVFAGDRVVLVSRAALPDPKQIDQLLSLDAKTGEIKDSRDLVGFGVRAIFASNDSHVIVSGASVMRLTPDLKDVGSFDFSATGHKHCRVQNVSPDGSTLGVATNPGYELLDAGTLKSTVLTGNGVVDTSVSNKGFVTDNSHWIRDYPKDISFITYTDAAGQHLLYHGKCGGRPQFLTDDLVFEPGCKNPLIVDTSGKLVRTLSVKGEFAYAAVSQNGKRFALQVASFSGMHSLKHERFVVYSVDSGEPIAEVTPDELAEGQSWTAFSPDGSMIVVGSPLKLTLFRLP